MHASNGKLDQTFTLKWKITAENQKISMSRFDVKFCGWTDENGLKELTLELELPLTVSDLLPRGSFGNRSRYSLKD